LHVLLERVPIFVRTLQAQPDTGQRFVEQDFLCALSVRRKSFFDRSYALKISYDTPKPNRKENMYETYLSDDKRRIIQRISL